MQTQERFPLQFFLLVLFGIGCSFLLSLFGLVLWSIVVCLGFMGFFAIQSYSNCAASAESEALVDHGEQLYLLGYLYTLAAILGVAMAGFADTQMLIKAGAVKLVTTVIGLAGMMIFKDIAHRWEKSERAAQSAKSTPESATAAPPPFPEEVAENAKKVSEVLSQTSASLQSCLAKTQTDIPAFLQSFEQTATRLQTIESTLQRQAEEAQAITERLARANENLAPLSAAVETLNGGVLKANDGLETLAAGSEYAHAALRSLETNIASSTQTFLVAVNKVEKGLTVASQQIPNSISGLNEFFAATKGLEPAFKAMSEQFQRLTNEMFKNFASSIEAVAANSEAVTKRLPEFCAALNEINEETKNTAKHLTNFGSAVGKITDEPVKKLGEGLELLNGQARGIGDTDKVVAQTITAFQQLLSTITNLDSELRQVAGQLQARIEIGHRQIEEVLQNGSPALSELNANIETTNRVLGELVTGVDGKRQSGFFSRILGRH